MSAIRMAPILFRSALVAGLASLAFAAYAKTAAEAPRAEKGKSVTSKDGTRIKYDLWGSGPAVIVVGGALSDRSGSSELAQLLAKQFSVYSYDRRGRGESGDTQPYSVEREVEDLEALIDAAGGSAYVYGKSSGAALSLHAAAALGEKISRLAIYEAPYNEADGAAKQWKDFRKQLDALLAEKRHEEAVAAFMAFVGVPPDAIAKLKASPAWPGMVKMAPTIAYDNAILGDERAVPAAIAAKIKARTLVLDGSASEQTAPFMGATADKLGKLIPGAERQVIEGQAHDIDSRVLAPVLIAFFR